MTNSTQIQQIWQFPPAPIDKILDAPAPPSVLLSPNYRWLVELERPLLHPIAEMGESEIAVAGLRINPKTNGAARQYAYRNLKIKAINSGETVPLNLPLNVGIRFIEWSPDGKRLAFTLTQESGFELWVLELSDGRLYQLTDAILNAAHGTPYQWLPGDEGLICKIVPDSRGNPPSESQIPQGPTVQENLGRKTPNQTYTNLLKNSYDEALFEYYLTSVVERVDLNGKRTLLVGPSLVEEAKPSPDGRFILVTTWHRPFSYQVPVQFFPQRIEILDQTGKVVHHLADLQLADNISIKFDSVRLGLRLVSWRSDRPATLYWVEALDGGDAGCSATLRDALFEMDAPFSGKPTLLWQSEYRFQQIFWGRDDVALACESWYDNRRLRVWRLNPSHPQTRPQLLIERSSEDKYSAPGTPLMVVGLYGRQVLRFTPDGSALYLKGRGASPLGIYPFLDWMDLDTSEVKRLWQSEDPYYESVLDILDANAEKLVTYRQSQTEPPNYFLHIRGRNQAVPLTHYQDPAPQLSGIHKEIIRYQRSDETQLSATLYLPPGYEPARNGPLPTIFWIYPREFKSRNFAGQVTASENTFSRPFGASPLLLLTQGYAVLSNPSLPILGEGGIEPNDSYVEQIVAGAQAAVDYLVNRGITDSKRVGIGGHSYGAFTTANLLAHTDLFRAGVACSGAYNRTLTPFGFQGEQRNFWEATDVYMQMSPFTHAAKINKPLLLIHGTDDSNTGTYPLQSERFYQALKGLGATVRLVMLPFEEHSYRSREGVGHALWEMIHWYNLYVMK